MISSYDKAWVALAGLILFGLNEFAGLDLSLTDGQFQGLVSALTAIGVFVVPNKAK